MMVNLIAICQNFGRKMEHIKNVYGYIFKKNSHTLEFDKNLQQNPGKIYFTFITLESKTYLNNKATITTPIS
jgi:hypothetical protein